MPIRVDCPTCGKRLNAPDNAAGKKAKCPGCGNVIRIPEVMPEAEPADPVASDDAPGLNSYAQTPDEPAAAPEHGGYDLLNAPPLPIPPTETAAANTDRKPCPMCGEMIATAALKCRYCGEVFDARLKKSQKKAAVAGDEDSTLSTGEWVVAILCSGIGCILGIVWMIQGKPKGIKMVGVSICASLIWGVIRAMIEGAAEF